MRSDPMQPSKIVILLVKHWMQSCNRTKPNVNRHLQPKEKKKRGESQMVCWYTPLANCSKCLLTRKIKKKRTFEKTCIHAPLSVIEVDRKQRYWRAFCQSCKLSSPKRLTKFINMGWPNQFERAKLVFLFVPFFLFFGASFCCFCFQFFPVLVYQLAYISLLYCLLLF